MAEPTFEEKLAQLENIVNQLEQGDVPLEKALDQFKAGVKLSQDLEKTLKTAEKPLPKWSVTMGRRNHFRQRMISNEPYVSRMAHSR